MLVAKWHFPLLTINAMQSISKHSGRNFYWPRPWRLETLSQYPREHYLSGAEKNAGEIFQQDAAAHFTVHDKLNERFLGGWREKEGPISLDLTPNYFHLWGHVNGTLHGYSRPAANKIKSTGIHWSHWRIRPKSRYADM